MPQRVLLTGANGYLASWILSYLLSRGHSVRAVVRSQAKASKILTDFPSSSSQLDFAIVPDITAPGAFNSAVQSTHPFTVVMHTASPFHHSITTNAEYLDPAIKGTTEILRSIKTYAPSIERVILTSSFAANLDTNLPRASTPRKIYTEEDWNPITYEEAVSKTGRPLIAYFASKKVAELEAWKFVENENPNFDLVTLCPPAIYGPLRHSISHVSELNETTGQIYDRFMNSRKDNPLPPDGVNIYVDVRDIALAHILAMEIAEAGNQRFLVTAGQASAQRIADSLRRDFEEELGERTPIGTPGTDSLPENAYGASTEKIRRVLGWKPRAFEETFGEMVRQILDTEKRQMEKRELLGV